MREIEFRGKEIDTGNWIYDGDLLKLLEHQINQETIGRYTELKDKNRKKIFQGDIVLYEGNKYIVCCGEYNENPENCAEEIEVGIHLRSIKDKFTQYKGTVPFYSTHVISARFPKYCAVDDNLKKIIERKLKVIGNIYDNPELLKEEL